MPATCKHWAAQQKCGFTRSICSDCPKRAEILANRKAAKMQTATKAPQRVTLTTNDPARLAARSAVVEADLAKLREELAAEQKARTQRVTVATQSPQNPAQPQAVTRNPHRPNNIAEMVGQTKALRQLRLALHGARLRGEPMPHTLLMGPPGYGKTSLGAVLADEIGATFVATNGVLLKKPDDLIALLVSQSGPTLLLIDECHRIGKTCAEAIYGAMEDGRLDLLANGEATSHQLDELVVIGATTSAGLLPAPLKARFGLTVQMDDYSEEEIATIVSRAWDRKQQPYVDSEALEVAKRSRGVPRRALALSDRVRDFVTVNGEEKITEGTVDAALSTFGIDSHGLTDTDYRILSALTKTFSGRPVGLAALSQVLDLEEDVIAHEHEGYLAKCGYLVRTPRGRLATAAAYELMQAP